jgi:nucleoside-diphosphate-sugar epimerase
MNSWAQSNQPLSGKRVFVTGAAGFIGSQLARALLACGCRVSVLLRRSSDCWRLRDILPQLKIHYGDLSSLSFEEARAGLSSSDMIFHLAAAGIDAGKPDAEAILKTNVLGTLTLLKLARHWNVERFINCGSCSEYGKGHFLAEDAPLAPICEYGVSKVSAGVLAKVFQQRYGVPVVSLRPFTAYGPFEARHRLIPHVILSALEGRDIELTAGEQTRDFDFVEDVVEAFLKAAAVPGIAGETFNVATGRATPVREAVVAILNLMETTAKSLFGATPYRESELWESSGDPRKAEARLNWKAGVSLTEGLRKTIRWFQENRDRAGATAYAG